MPDVQVRRSWIHAELDPEGALFLEFLLKLRLADNLSAAQLKLSNRFFRRCHGVPIAGGWNRGAKLSTDGVPRLAFGVSGSQTYTANRAHTIYKTHGGSRRSSELGTSNAKCQTPSVDKAQALTI